MILACQNIDKAFGTNVIVQNGSFHIEDREKAAIVGVNGAGKSTLLKMIIGEMAPDKGTVVLSKGKSIGYLAQHQEMHLDMTIYDALLEVKQDILALERRIRSLELQMKQVEGEALEELLETLLGRKVFIFAIDRDLNNKARNEFVNLQQVNKLPNLKDINLVLPKEIN